MKSKQPSTGLVPGMFTRELAQEVGLSVGRLASLAKSLDVEVRCGRRWWSPEKIELLKQELARRAEAQRIKSLYPRTVEVASRLGIEVCELLSVLAHGSQARALPSAELAQEHPLLESGGRGLSPTGA